MPMNFGQITHLFERTAGKKEYFIKYLQIYFISKCTSSKGKLRQNPAKMVNYTHQRKVVNYSFFVFSYYNLSLDAQIWHSQRGPRRPGMGNCYQKHTYPQSRKIMFVWELMPTNVGRSRKLVTWEKTLKDESNGFIKYHALMSWRREKYVGHHFTIWNISLFPLHEYVLLIDEAILLHSVLMVCDIW